MTKDVSVWKNQGYVEIFSREKSCSAKWLPWAPFSKSAGDFDYLLKVFENEFFCIVVKSHLHIIWCRWWWRRRHGTSTGGLGWKGSCYSKSPRQQLPWKAPGPKSCLPSRVLWSFVKEPSQPQLVLLLFIHLQAFLIPLHSSQELSPSTRPVTCPSKRVQTSQKMNPVM